MHTVDFMRLPGEIRNKTYDYIICGLSQASSRTSLPAIAFANVLIHQEFLSKVLPYIHCNITSILDIWNTNMLLDMHAKGTGLHRIARLTITNFTSIAYSPSRASEVMDFLCQFNLTRMLTLDIALVDLHRGFRGRVKEIDHVLQEYELFRIGGFSMLAKLVINVKHNGAVLTPESVSLLTALKDWLANDVLGEVVFCLIE